MQSSKESSQHTGPLGDLAKPKPADKSEPEEKWLPCSTPGYVKSTKTGAVKRKED